MASSLVFKNIEYFHSIMIIQRIWRNNELLAWVSALLWLYFMVDPGQQQPGYCPFHWLGFDQCPGCGIGRSIHAAMHLQWKVSWNYHWMGIPALIIILHRIYSLIQPTTKHLIHAKLSGGTD
ncbi:DUF2752 domain-containing protein [Flavihumibacter sediminis]|nr:DUF2752 domain-containing protein [Flavihumibacter sediminis]